MKFILLQVKPIQVNLKQKMIKLKIVIVALCLSITNSSCNFIGNVLRTGYTNEQCNQIAANFDKLKIGMAKNEVINLIGEESNNIIYRSPGLFPEQKTEWEIWMLCVDSKSCIFQQSLGREQCYRWHMIAFDTKNNKLIKVFSDDPERIGFN